MQMSIRFALAIIFIGSTTGSIPVHAQTILTLGSGFNSPQDVAVDGIGNVFVGDYLKSSSSIARRCGGAR